MRVEDQSCCFWVQHSNGCARIKQGSATILAALSIIAIVSGILLILAQQGYNLAGINSIAQLVETSWIYLGIGTAVALLVFDTIFICAHVRAYLDKTLSEQELEQLGIEGYLSDNRISEQIPSYGYAEVDIPAQSGSLPFFVLVFKEGSKRSTIGYRRETDRLVHVARLRGESFQDALVSPEYRLEYVQSLYPQYSTFQADCTNTMRHPGSYRIRDVSVPEGPTFYLLAIGNFPSPLHRAFKTEASRTDYIQRHCQDFFNYDQVADAIRALPNHDNEIIINGRTCYLAWLNNGTCEFFATAGARDNFLRSST